jgi:lipoprotein-releasing system ATP-binding protein
LLNSPRLIFGDEPTGNLDSESGDVVWGALTEMARDGATVIVATHDTQRAARCDEWVRL